MDDFALATVPTGPDEAEGPPPTNFYEPRDNLGPAGHQINWTGNTFVDPERLGLRSPGKLPLVTIAYLIAQKLHACTDHADIERPNDRYRDLIDLILVDRLVHDEDRSEVRAVCVETFRLRDAWPPRITVPPDWPDGYQSLAQQLGFVPADVHHAAIDVQAIVARIDAVPAT